MPDIEKGSTAWLDKLASLEAELQGKTSGKPKQVQLAKTLKVSRRTVQIFLDLRECFDAEALALVRQAAPACIFSLNKAIPLIGLKDRVKDRPGAVKAVLEKAISANLQTYQIKALVEWVTAGQAIEDFDPAQVKKPTKWDNLKTDTDEEGDGEEQPEEEKTKKTGWFFKKKSGKKTTSKTSKASTSKGKKQKAGSKAAPKAFKAIFKDLKKDGKLVWRKVAKFIFHGWCKAVAGALVPVKSSRSSGSRRSRHSGNRSLPSFETLLQRAAHGAVYLFCQVFFWEFILSFIPFPFLRHGIKWPFRQLAHLFLVDFPLWVWDYDWHHWGGFVLTVVVLGLGLGSAFKTNTRHTAFLIAILGAAWWWFGVSGPSESNPLAFGIRLLSAHRPQVDGRALNVPVPETGTGADFHLSLPPFFSRPAETTSTPLPEQPALRSSESVGGASHANSGSELAQPNLAARLVGSQQAQVVAFNGNSDALALLQSAVSCVSDNSVIKDFPVTPDSSMGSLMAVNRVTDLAVESEYSLRVGQGGKKVTSVTPSATGLVIATEDGLPLGGLLGDGSKWGFYWEDVQTIFCSELDTPSGKTYQVSWAATNLSQPIVVQCHTPNNLDHLVSALEYFIKAAQGKYIPVTGMPYLNQGLVLGDENKITALWAKSPAEQAGLTFQDHVWSISGNRHQEKADLEAALQALPPGKRTINVVTPADWQAAREQESKAKNGVFQPKLTGFELLVP